ncbi:MAG: helix-turn-helix domain-containing protein [Streptococcaceae bacterium]|jgi:Rgg/GadR/MutR family transcriptional activator|nr:helix-turn-helix domain-containing protein [Streptococcaceae bacterium]
MTEIINKTNQEFGKVFRNFRKGKKFTLAETAGEILSQSQLARFERGQSKLSTDLFFQILQSINVSAQEFEATYNAYVASDNDTLSSFGINQAFLSKNIAELDFYLSEAKNKLKKEPKKLKLQLNKIIVEAVIFQTNPRKKIPKQDLEFLKHYLKNIDIWGDYETGLLQWTTNAWDSYTLASLTSSMLAPVRLGQKTYQNEVFLIQTVLNVINAFIEMNNLFQAQRYINFLEEWGISEYFLNERLTLNCHRARLIWKSGDEAGLEMHKKNLEIFNYCGCFNLAKLVEAEIVEMEAEGRNKSARKNTFYGRNEK